MVKTVGALALAATLLVCLPSMTQAWDHPHKYGVELQLGAGYLSMGDVNDFIPDPAFANISPDEVNLGLQFGVGLLYRHMNNFGWYFGYNRFMMLQKYKMSAYLSPIESWAEQTVSGGELYALATWYWPTDIGEFSFGVGPAYYSATLDRSIDLVKDGQTHLTSGTFADAKGKGFGLVGNLGLEFYLKEMLGLSFNLGGRLATIDKLTWEDASGTERAVFVGSSNQTLAVDYSGLYAKITLRAYFRPASGWRTPVH